MPTKCVQRNQCGTHAPGWLSGAHPTVAEGAVQRKVCFHWSSGCCQWSRNIQVRNCGGYFVYELEKPPTCSLRYCGEKTQGREIILIGQATAVDGPVPSGFVTVEISMCTSCHQHNIAI